MHLFLFLFKTLVDLLIIGLMLRIFCSLWINNTNPIHQAIVLMTNPLIRPLSPYIRNKKQLILLLVGLSLMIKFFSLWFAFSLYCLVGLNLLQLLALSLMTLITFVLKYQTIDRPDSRTNTKEIALPSWFRFFTFYCHSDHSVSYNDSSN